MLIHIDPNRGVPYYRQVREQVTRMILAGMLKPGEKMESVAKLSKRLKVNPMTISKAYSFMVEEKLLERRPGIGLFVAALPDDKQRNMTNALLAETLEKAATLAIQLGLPEIQAMEMFRNSLSSAKAGEKNES